jgi:hypothetical protein
MLKLSQLLEAKRRESNDTMGDPSPLSRQPPQSPLTASTPVSPAVSLFSAKGHTRFSSSASSLVSSPGHGNSMDISCRNPLTGVKEEEPYGSQARDLEEEYFRMQPLPPVSFCFDLFSWCFELGKKIFQLTLDSQSISIKDYPSLKIRTYPQSLLATVIVSLIPVWIWCTLPRRDAPTMFLQTVFPALDREYPLSPTVGSPNEDPTAQMENHSHRRCGLERTLLHLYLPPAQLQQPL